MMDLGVAWASVNCVNGAEVSDRRFVWCDDEICEERDSSGLVLKRFFAQGLKVEAGASAGAYFYAHDHLGSLRELTDGGGNVRARVTYDPFGRHTLLAGDTDPDFGFAGMFWTSEASINLTWFRAYDSGIARWLSRDPLKDAETSQGANLFTYVRNNVVNRADPLGLYCCDNEKDEVIGAKTKQEICLGLAVPAIIVGGFAGGGYGAIGAGIAALGVCSYLTVDLRTKVSIYSRCLLDTSKPCECSPTAPGFPGIPGGHPLKGGGFGSIL